MVQFDEELDLVIAQAQDVTSRTLSCMPTAVRTMEESAFYGGREVERDSDPEEAPKGLGNGNAVIGMKATYVRHDFIFQVRHVREMNDSTAFERHCHFFEDEFVQFLGDVDADLSQAMNPRLKISQTENILRTPRARSVHNEDPLFFMLETLGGSTECSLGVARFSELYRFCNSTLSNYFRHSLFSVQAALICFYPPLIR